MGILFSEQPPFPVETYFCPLTEKEITDTECYEIQSVRYYAMKMDSLGYVFDRAKADNACAACPFCQI